MKGVRNEGMLQGQLLPPARVVGELHRELRLASLVPSGSVLAVGAIATTDQGPRSRRGQVTDTRADPFRISRGALLWLSP